MRLRGGTHEHLLTKAPHASSAQQGRVEMLLDDISVNDRPRPVVNDLDVVNDAAVHDSRAGVDRGVANPELWCALRSELLVTSGAPHGGRLLNRDLVAGSDVVLRNLRVVW